jgi:perosamine synthetase
MSSVFPRQRLYDVNHTGFIKALFGGTVNTCGSDGDEKALEHAVKQAFAELTGIHNFVPLSRGRLAGYFGVKHSVTSERRKVIMSPFTIFDLVNMVRVAGGEPYFIDSKAGCVHLSCQSIEDAIDDQTAAVIVTHYHSTNREIFQIAELCRQKGVALIEDCAISIGAKINGQHVGSFGDFALFSFGLFKFVSTYYGGGMVIREPSIREAVEKQLATWPRMISKDLMPYALKGAKLSFLTSRTLFNNFTFPLFRLGYLNNIEFIKKNAQNDPDPFLREILPGEYMVRPSLFQLREFERQIPLVKDVRDKRLANALLYYENFTKAGIGGLPARPDFDVDCYLNFPILLTKDRDWFVREMMRSGFDLAIYYYRNCAEIDAFVEYHKSLPNIKLFVNNMVFFPTYPSVERDYIDRLTKRAVELLV